MNAIFGFFMSQYMLFLELHFGKQIHNPPLRWWIDRDGGTWKEVRILSDFNTILFSRATKNTTRGRHHGKIVYIWNKHEVGVKIDPDTGKVKMWVKESTNRKGKANYKTVNFYSFMYHATQMKVVEYVPGTGDYFTGGEILREYIPLVDEFLAHHGAQSLEDLIIPAAKDFGIISDVTSHMSERNGMDRTPWMDYALGARTLAEFWTRMGRTVKLAKDEKRALVALIKHNQKYMAFARIATRISIPNIRTLTIPEAKVERGLFSGPQVRDPWNFIIPNSDNVNIWMMGLRKVTPHRRVMFLQNWGRTATDTLQMLAQLRKAGEVEEWNYRSVEEYHEAARLAIRFLREKNREIPEVQGRFWTPRVEYRDGALWKVITEKRGVDGVMIGDIRVVSPSDTHMVIAWGEHQHHCIGSYASMAADGHTTLLGFKRGDEWVGHCSISRRRCEQLLGQFNRSLTDKDRTAILEWLVSVDLIDKATTGWG